MSQVMKVNNFHSIISRFYRFLSANQLMHITTITYVDCKLPNKEKTYGYDDGMHHQ
jgi:hypothetical protein